MKLSFRAVWYAAIVWIFAFLTSGIVIAPWYYLVMPLVVLMLTVYYFDDRTLLSIRKNDPDLLIKYGLGVAIFWFLTAGILSLFEVIGFYYFDFAFYFSDFRNVFLFPLTLLVPMVYGIVLSNLKFKRRRRGKKVALRRFVGIS